MTSTDIILLRHGTTLANLEKRFAGRTEEPLHPQGVVEVERLCCHLASSSINGVVTSPLARATETGAILSRGLGVGVAVDHRLAEISIPHWDGLSKTEIRQKFGWQYPLWLAEPQNFMVSGCETISEVQQRAVACTEELFERYHGQTILLVSHLIVIRSLVLFYRQMGLQLFRSIEVPNGSLCRLRRNRDRTSVTLDAEQQGSFSRE